MIRGVRTAAFAAAALTLLVPVHAAADGVPQPSAPALLLAQAGNGVAVISALGDQLLVAASINQMSPTTLREILTEDPTAWIGPDGQLFYVEALPTPAEGAATTGSTNGTVTPAYAANGTFDLHSRPRSTRKIFLDFDGADVSGTWWNAHGGMPARFYTGFTLNADPSSFTSDEHAYIRQVWRIVAEKYAPFDVDVTTQDPGADGYNRADSSDQSYGDHVVITDDRRAVDSACGGSCSGVALLGTFDDTRYTDSYLEPAWVFSSKTHGSAALTAHTVAHEVGHTFDLYHDGHAGGREYSSGHGNWFPIMGSTGKAVGQFSQGEYAGANNTQDDLAVIGSNGAPQRADDYPDAVSSAVSLGSAGAYEVDGVISTRADRDVIAIDHPCTNAITASATGTGTGAALDIRLSVIGPSGDVIGTANPSSGQNATVWPATPTGLDASLTVRAKKGRHYVRVDGVGKGDPASDGYSDYASVGIYHLSINGCGGATITTDGTTTTSSGGKRASAPRIRRASSGRGGGPVTATARWSAPQSTGGAAITGYRVRAEKLSRSGRVVRTARSRMLSPGAHSMTMRLPKGRYRFRVIAYNRSGASPMSTSSRAVVAR